MKPTSAILAAVAAALPAAASAQDFMSAQLIPPMEETLVVNLGGILNTFDTSLRVDGEARSGTPINLEDNGLKENLTSFEATALWRVARRHRLGIQYYGAERDGSRTYTTSIDIGEESFPLGATVSARSRAELVNVDYRYSFVQEPAFELAGVLGLYGGKMEWDVSAVGIVAGTSRSYNKTLSTTVPLPVIGLSADWYPDRAWRVGLMASGMKADIGSVNGHAYVLGANVDYQLTRGWGVGARYGFKDIQADVDGSKLDGNFEYKSSAVSLYMRIVF